MNTIDELVSGMFSRLRLAGFSARIWRIILQDWVGNSVKFGAVYKGRELTPAERATIGKLVSQNKVYNLGHRQCITHTKMATGLPERVRVQ